MSRLDDVVNTLNSAIGNAIVAAGVVGTTINNPVKNLTFQVAPGQVERGNPLVTEIVNIFAQGDGQWQINTWPLKAKATTRWSPFDGVAYTPPASPLTASRSGNTFTLALAGSITTPLNAWVVANNAGGAYAQIVSSDTVDTAAAKIIAAVNAANIPGVSASGSGASFTIAGASRIAVNIGGSGAANYEVERLQRLVQVDIWASDPYTRSLLADAIEQRVGTTLNTFLNLPDNTGLFVSNAGNAWDDDSQSSYSLYIEHMTFEIEYGVMFSDTVVQLGAVENSVTASNASLATVWVG
ncbi:MAG: hypothetical protein KGL39_22020 [Patescibacteria group bacterium]|nr:hypothetical protein [Patescibacteria group bacterium]